MDVVRLIIKKDYAASLIEHLKNEHAIEVIEDNEQSIPEWQKEAVRKTLQMTKEHPELLQSWEQVKQKYKRS